MFEGLCEALHLRRQFYVGELVFFVKSSVVLRDLDTLCVTELAKAALSHHVGNRRTCLLLQCVLHTRHLGVELVEGVLLVGHAMLECSHSRGDSGGCLLVQVGR